MIDLHYSATPNGQKIAIVLEEIGASYRVIPYDIFNGDADGICALQQLRLEDPRATVLMFPVDAAVVPFH